LYFLASVASERFRKTPARARRPPGNPAGRRWIVHGLLFFAAVAFVANALVGDQGVVATLRARRQYDQLAATIARLRAENARLGEEARRLREDPAAIEEIARRDLGLIRPGEKVFIVKDLPTPAGR
jgi:cell division protein FtsB